MKIGEGPKLPPLPGGKTDATKSAGKGVSTFPDVAKTPTPGGAVPIPYPNVGGDTFERAGSKVPSPLLGGPSALGAASSPPTAAEVAKQVGGLLGTGQGASALAAWIGGVASGGPRRDVPEMLAGVLREAVASTNEDKQFYLEKMQTSNDQAEALSDYLGALVDASGALAEKAKGKSEDSSPPVIARSEPSALEKAADADRFAELVTGFATAKEELRELVADLRASDISAFEDEIRAWEEKLNGVGDDAQLANVDLQNILQKQQQTLQMMSNISKMLYDTAQSVIRKMGG